MLTEKKLRFRLRLRLKIDLKPHWLPETERKRGTDKHTETILSLQNIHWDILYLELMNHGNININSIPSKTKALFTPNIVGGGGAILSMRRKT